MSPEDTAPGAATAGASPRRQPHADRACVGGAPRPRLLELAPPPTLPPTTRQGRGGERRAGLVEQAVLGWHILTPWQLQAHASPSFRFAPRAGHHRELSQMNEYTMPKRKIDKSSS